MLEEARTLTRRDVLPEEFAVGIALARLVNARDVEEGHDVHKDARDRVLDLRQRLPTVVTE